MQKIAIIITLLSFIYIIPSHLVSIAYSQFGVQGPTSDPYLNKLFERTDEIIAETDKFLKKDIPPELMEGPTNDPLLNTQFSVTDSMLIQTNPQNQHIKDKTWSPPSNQQDLMDTCTTQTNKLGINVNKHCNGLIYNCKQSSLTSQECYALNFVNSDVNVPEEVYNSLQSKLNAVNIASDKSSEIMKEFYEREKKSLQSTACMPYCD